MRVLLTGASGFLGCHTVAALLDAGHTVRALARSSDSVTAALEPVGVNPDAVEIRLGDVTNQATVADALRDCDAVVHAAALVAFSPREARQTYRANVRAGEVVLGSASRLGLDPLVHISGVPAMLPCAEHVLTPDSPPGRPPAGYLRSKAALEQLARRLQAEGAPVVIVQPGLLLGPHDPKLGMGTRLVRDTLAGKTPVVPAAGLPLGDVRDVAAAISRAVEAGAGPRRYMTGGTYARFADLVDLIADIGGAALPRKVISPRLALAAGRIADTVERLVGKRLPITAAEAWVALHDPHTDDSRAREELDFLPRELRVTIADTIHWLLEGGHVAAGELVELRGCDGVHLGSAT
jgi:dihydroflavonol-4-reductase